MGRRQGGGASSTDMWVTLESMSSYALLTSLAPSDQLDMEVHMHLSACGNSLEGILGCLPE